MKIFVTIKKGATLDKAKIPTAFVKELIVWSSADYQIHQKIAFEEQE